MTIYVTEFDPSTLQATAASTDSGFGSLDEAVSVLGEEYVRRSYRCVIYPGVMISDFEVSRGGLLQRN